MATAPFELLSGPVTLYTSAVNTAAPEISAAPPAAWELLGQNGDKSYGDDGVTITPDQTIEEQMVLGSTAAQKAFRTEEHLSLTVMLLDVSAENLAKVMNGAAVTDTACGLGRLGRSPFFRPAAWLRRERVRRLGQRLLALRGQHVGPVLAAQGLHHVRGRG